jgi:DNA-binding transcriptional ArsR family regulator
MADKMTLIALFRANPESWLSLAAIKSGTEKVPDRTLRNWLKELVKDGSVEAQGERKGRRYRLRLGSMPGAGVSIAAGVAQLAGIHEIFSAESLALIRRIEAPIYTRPPATYREDWLQSYVPNESTYLSPERRAELAALGKRDPIYGKAGTYIKKIYDRLLIDFSFNSSRLEGNTYSLADTEKLLLHGAAAPGKPNAERIMILNHKEAIAYLVRDVATLQVDEPTIRTLHYLLADSLVAPELAGQIRDESVRVSGSTYAPLEGRQRLTKLLDTVLAKARAIADPFEQGFFLLVHISYLQPFIDVNKRTARLASILPLIKGDYVPQSFVDANQDAYLKATIAVYELNEVGPLADVYAWSYRRSCQRFDTTATAVGFDEIAALYRTQRRAMVKDLVRSKILPDKVAAWVTEHVPVTVQPQHREKFISDVLAEIEHLDSSRIGGLGITKEELEAWEQLKRVRQRFKAPPGNRK